LGHSICAIAFAPDRVENIKASVDLSENALQALNLTGETEPETETETDASPDISGHFVSNNSQMAHTIRVINIDPNKLRNPQFEDLSNVMVATTTTTTTTTTPVHSFPSTPNRLPPIDSGNNQYSTDLGLLNMESIVINHISQQDDDRSVASSGNKNTIVFMFNVYAFMLKAIMF
jgi:hypothetical protein